MTNKKRESNKRYSQSEKGKVARKVAQKRYRQTDKGRATEKYYQQTDRGKIIRKVAKELYQRTDKGKAAMRYHLYGLSLEDYNKLRAQQENKCRICSKEFNDRDYRDICVDHEHKAGIVRGLLCRKCNAALGFFDDDICRLANAIKYLGGGQ